MLQVKGNQPKLRAALLACHQADPQPSGACHQYEERRDGCINTWQTSCYTEFDPLLQAQWAGAAGVVVVTKTVVGAQATTQQTRYYLTSLSGCSAATFAAGIRGHPRASAGIRGHWGIENKLHRTRDVHFGQDTNGIRHRVAAVNVAIFNTLALNYLLDHIDSSISYAQLFFAHNFKNFMP